VDRPKPEHAAERVDTLAQDGDSWVRWNALLHPQTPAHTLQAMADQEAAMSRPRWFHVRSVIVHHPNTSPTLRQELLAVGACRTCPSDTCPGFLPFRRRQSA